MSLGSKRNLLASRYALIDEEQMVGLTELLAVRMERSWHILMMTTGQPSLVLHFANTSSNRYSPNYLTVMVNAL